MTTIRVDTSRFTRTGVAEAVYAPGKTPEEIFAAACGLLAARTEAGEDDAWPVLATRLEAAQAREVARLAAEAGMVAAWDEAARLLELEPRIRRRELGRAAVVAAGTTDRGPAAEAAAVLAAYGADVDRILDVGVAGIHRLLDPGTMALLLRARVIVAVAGMEGALPTVIAGLVAAPVIGLPSPVGYGVAEGGRAALTTMLASCAPGLAVVNVDNGFGAATMAVKILRSARPELP